MNFRPQELIPGAFELRKGRSTVHPTVAGAPAGMAPALAAPVYDRERLEREREGGGAPNERAGAGPRTIFARLFHLLAGRHPAS